MLTQPFKQILFLCTGNYYRSRFAEHLFNALAEAHQVSWHAESRGLAIEYGVNNVGAISRHARLGLSERGIILSAHERFPLQVLETDFARADKIVALDESEHRPLMQQRFPAWTERIEYWEIHDVELVFPKVALQQIEQQVKRLIGV